MSLTKTEYLRFLGCSKSAWLGRNRPDLRAPIGEVLLDLFESGRMLTETARTMFPGGVLMPETGPREQQVKATKRALAEEVGTLFEASFEAGGRYVRADVLVFRDEGLALYEVKSSASVKKEHIDDLAFQWATIADAGYDVASAHVVHVNKAAVFTGEPIEAEDLLVAVDVTDQVRGALARTVAGAEEAIATVEMQDAPDIATNKSCKGCDFYDHCHEDQDPLDIALLPRVRSEQVTKYRQKGLILASDLMDVAIPDKLSLAVRSLVSGETVVDRGLADVLSQIEFPAAFVDFEGVNPMIPVVPGLGPYGTFMFQWSCHFLDHPEQEVPSHKEFLDLEAVDPRGAFTSSLWEAVKHCRTIIHYSTYELTQVKSMSRLVSEHADDVRAAFERRSFDLLPVVRDFVYDPGFGGEFSIKKVLPALVPGMDYKDQTIADGQAAARAYLRARDPGTPIQERAVIEQDLKSYCMLDTLAMVQLYRKLRLLAK